MNSGIMVTPFVYILCGLLPPFRSLTLLLVTLQYCLSLETHTHTPTPTHCCQCYVFYCLTIARDLKYNYFKEGCKGEKCQRNVFTGLAQRSLGSRMSAININSPRSAPSFSLLLVLFFSWFLENEVDGFCKGLC